MPDRYATVGVTIVDHSGPTPTMHARVWPVAADFADQFAQWMTGLFGTADELLADAETMEQAGQRAAEAGDVLYLVNRERS